MPLDEFHSLYFGDKEQMTKLKQFLEANGIADVRMSYDDAEAVYDLQVREESKQKADALLREFLILENGSEIQESVGDVDEKSQPQSYQNSAERAEENRSSAGILLFVGAAGIIIVLLGIFGVIPFRLGNAYLFYGVLSAVFILFFVMGIVSMKNARVFAKKAESESNLQEILLKWCRENLRAEDIDKEIGRTSEDKEETLYFKRCERIREMLNHQFMNLDQALLDHFIDEKVYDMIFSKQPSE